MPLYACYDRHTIMSNADDFQDRPVRAGRLPPSHPTRISVFPYTSLLGNFSQDVYGRTSVPACHHNVRRGRLTYHALVIWITPFPLVTHVHPVRYILNLSARQILTNNLTGVKTHYPEMFLPKLFRHLQHGRCLCFTQERAVGTNNTPYSYTPKGRLCLVTPTYHLTVSTLSILRIRIAPLYDV
ncbi:MAG: hypothetical protein HW390_1863 [Candidatus Brocadiaceae bacterium]|nr:hypothetical protein [Candidatus Brocadiaceae bacterium]